MVKSCQWEKLSRIKSRKYLKTDTWGCSLTTISTPPPTHVIHAGGHAAILHRVSYPNREYDGVLATWECPEWQPPLLWHFPHHCCLRRRWTRSCAFPLRGSVVSSCLNVQLMSILIFVLSHICWPLICNLHGWWGPIQNPAPAAFVRFTSHHAVIRRNSI